MTGSVLLDTRVVVALLRGELAQADERVSQHELCVNTTVLGELLYGAARCSRREQQTSLVLTLVGHCVFLTCDASTARCYAEIKEQLARAGTPIPENDIWVAASAKEHGMTVAARDSHFNRVAGLQVEHW